jgi:hypothetical protein
MPPQYGALELLRLLLGQQIQISAAVISGGQP